MDDLLLGFLKTSDVSELVSAGVGAGIGYALGRKKSLAARLGIAAIGGETARQLARGVRGAYETPNLEGLTPGEQEVVESQADRLVAARRGRRVGSLTRGVSAAVLSGSPWAALPSLPGATIAPYADEVDRVNQLANDFRSARKKESA